MDDVLGKRFFLLAIGIVLTIIIIFTIVGEKGLVDVIRLKKEKERIVLKKKVLEAENMELSRRVELLKEDTSYIEEVARRELGMIGKDETLYIIEE